jgi:hypothetical protein
MRGTENRSIARTFETNTLVMEKLQRRLISKVQAISQH